MTGSEDRVILSAVAAAGAHKTWMSCDRIEAIGGGHGSIGLAVWAIANVVTEEVLRGADVRLHFANTARLPVEDLLRKAIDAAIRNGADGANAAMLSAAILYLAGSNVQAGVPAGNRKLGALARMIAKVDRSGVAAIPTSKHGNKVSGFAAVQAIYAAMAEKGLLGDPTKKLPEGAFGPFFGHSAIGEDLILPEMAMNGAGIGTKAMLEAMEGAYMPPEPFTAALIGAAAILEIIHPDAEVRPPAGAPDKINSAYLAGLGAVQQTDLPRELHMRVTGEVYDTARLIGDMGLVLKDVGAPTVVGMLALGEVFACFQEMVSGASGGPMSPPLSHVCSDAIVAMKGILAGKEPDELGESIVTGRQAMALDPEMMLVAINTMARKADGASSGPVSKLMLSATEPARVWALQRRAAKAHSGLSAGRSLAEVVRDLDIERRTQVEKAAGAMFSQMMGKPVSLAVTKIAPGTRRPGGRGTRFWAIDPDVDVTVTVDGQSTELKGLGQTVIPQVFSGEREDLAWAIPVAVAPSLELMMSAHTIINITVPAAVAAVMGKLSPADAAAEAVKAAFITSAIPGARERAEEVAKLAVRIMKG